jgi:hypothetical protein
MSSKSKMPILPLAMLLLPPACVRSDLGGGRHFVYVRAKHTVDGKPHVTWTSPVYIGPPR